MENQILGTITTLSIVLGTLTFVSLGVIQYLKEKWGLKDKAAEITSLCTGFVLSAGVVVSFLEQAGWVINISQGIGVGIFMVIGTIGPSGGYKLLRTLLGTNNE